MGDIGPAQRRYEVLPERQPLRMSVPQPHPTPLPEPEPVPDPAPVPDPGPVPQPPSAR